MNRMRTIGGGLLLAVAATAIAQDIPDDVNRTVRAATGVDLNLVLAEDAAAPLSDPIDRLAPANQPRFHGSAWLDMSTIDPPTGEVVGSLFAVDGPVRPGARPSVARAMPVRVDWEALGRLDPADPGRIAAPIFDGETLELHMYFHERRSDERFTWFGKIAGIAMSEVILVRYDEAVHLLMRDNATRRVWEARGNAAGEVVLREMSPDSLGANDCGTRCDAAADGDGAPREGGTAAAIGPIDDPADQIDLMVVTTAQAAADYGSAANFYAACNAMAADFNLRCNNTNDLSASVRVVAAYYATDFNETADGDDDLDSVSIDGDGFLDWVHEARNDVGADIVALIRSDSWGSTVGIAWRPATTGQMNTDKNNFSVSALGSGDFYRTVSHEIGHNFGACHDAATNEAADPPACTSAMTSSPHGYVDICDLGLFCESWRTTMAYSPGCTGGNYTLTLWSDPNAVVASKPFCPDFNAGDSESDVRSLMNTTRLTLSQRRIGAKVKWSQSGSTGGNGTQFAPFATMSASVDAVQGGLAEGIVRVKAGTINETAALGGTVTYGTPCTVTTEGGTATIQ